MSRHSLMIVVTAIAFHVLLSSSTSFVTAQDSSTARTITTQGPRIKNPKTREKLIKLEKAEEVIDKEIKKETARRENATSVTPKENAVANDELCNNALEVDFSRPGSVTLCTCGVYEVLMDGKCTEYTPGITIMAERNIIFKEEVPVSNFRVRVQDLECKSGVTHRNMTFAKGTFYLRNRGDIVLTEAVGDIAGLRISDYCINHFLDEAGSLSWEMKACIPHPVVPRCCPANHVLRNGTCVTGPSPEHLYPAIQADPRGGDPLTWPVVRNQVNQLTCGSDSIMSVALDINGSYVLALANGLAYRWYMNGPNLRSDFKFCPDFCVDGRQGVDAAVEFHVNFCHTPVEKRTKEVCKTETCIQKCCKRGEIMSVDHYRCMKYQNETFQPPVSDNLTKYEVIISRPNCAIHLSEVSSTVIDTKGNWQVGEYTLHPSDYCVDTFAIRGTKKTMALICPGEGNFRAWWKVRQIIFPVCHVISLVFLGITVGFYLLAPVLLKQGGWHQLSYVLSLMLAYASTFSLNVYNHRITQTGCVGIALLMQLGFLSTFFWLCVMCFDIESKIRSLKKFQAYVPLHPMAYVTFGVGGPLVISLITLIIHTTVPYGTYGVITPNLGISRCWFHGDMELLVYFYGPIALLFMCNVGLIASTAWHYRCIEQGALGLAMKSAKEDENHSSQPSEEYDRQKQTRKNFAEFKHTFLLLSLMCFCWITEVLSWKIPPAEIWAFTDVLNSLQGLFIFVIFLSNRRNRKIMKNRHPRLYSIFLPVKTVFRKIRGLFLKKSRNYNSSPENGVGLSREPSISSEFSELSENNKPAEPTAT